MVVWGWGEFSPVHIFKKHQKRNGQMASSVRLLAGIAGQGGGGTDGREAGTQASPLMHRANSRTTVDAS